MYSPLPPSAEAARPAVKREDSGKLVADFERLLDSSTLTDVKIKCEGKILECHKAILSARCRSQGFVLVLNLLIRSR